MPGLRQRCFSLSGNGPALANLALTGLLSGWLHTTPPFKGAECVRGLWKMNVNGTARGGRLGSSSECRRVPARMNRSCDRFGLEDGPTAVKPQRVKGSGCAQLPLYTQWPRLKSIEGGSIGTRNPAVIAKIRSQTRAVSGIAALVTTPLRSLVTRAPSDQASPAPGIRLSQGWLFDQLLRAFGRTCLPTGVHRRRSTRPRPWHASLCGSRCRGGQLCGDRYYAEFTIYRRHFDWSLLSDEYLPFSDNYA